VGGGTAGFRQLAGRFGEGCCRRRPSNEGRERGVCDQIVGFACSLVDRAGPFPLFSRLKSPNAPWRIGDGVGSPDGLRPKSEGKRGTGGATEPYFAVRMKKTAAGDLAGLVAGDALTLTSGSQII
jgi:hypothetical protein